MLDQKKSRSTTRSEPGIVGVSNLNKHSRRRLVPPDLTSLHPNDHPLPGSVHPCSPEMPSLLAQLPRNLAALKTKSRSDSTLTASLPLAAVSMPHSAGSHGPDMRGFGDALQRNNGGGTQVGASPAGPARPSAYQRALDVLKQLNALPGVAALIPWPEIDPRKSWQIDMTDPMRILLETCRLGEPLCFLYNSLRPREPLEMPSPESSAPSGFQSFISASMGSLFADAEDADLSRRKRAVSNFLRACRQVGFVYWVVERLRR